MKAADRIEDFRAAVETLLSDDKEITVVVEDRKPSFTVIATYKSEDGKDTYYNNVVVNLPRPDLRKPIPFELVREAVENIVRKYEKDSRDPRYTEASRERARQAWERCKL